MAFNTEAGGGMQYVDDRGGDSALLAETHLMLATLSAILVDLSESYYAIVHGAGGCLGGLLRAGELELVVQEALAAYQRQVLRRNVTYVDDDDGGDVSDWVGLLSTRVEGRVRRRSLLTDVSVTDWRTPVSTGHGLMCTRCMARRNRTVGPPPSASQKFVLLCNFAECWSISKIL